MKQQPGPWDRACTGHLGLIQRPYITLVSRSGVFLKMAGVKFESPAHALASLPHLVHVGLVAEAARDMFTRGVKGVAGGWRPVGEGIFNSRSTGL